MEGKQEMQFLGVFGIYKETYNIISSWGNIFFQITLVFILPRCFLSFLDSQVSHTIQLSEQTTTYWLFKAACFTLFLVFSLLSTSVLTYTIACIYEGSKVSFKKVISVFPKVWKRLLITDLCTIVAFLLYIIVMFAFLRALGLFISSNGNFSSSTISLILTVLLSLGLVYLSVLWQLASVVSMLEDESGLQAMNKSMALTKGKRWNAFIIFVSLTVSSLLRELLAYKLVNLGGSLGMVARVAYGIICFLLLLTLSLFSHTVETVFYFVCKSYHREETAMSILSDDHDHIAVYLDDQQVDIPLMAEENSAQHEQSYV
ncbi:polyadenylate-binding protein 1-B-binding protein [Parasponia andersonii]|uniref:Polyadenylate-binding protein 1-B-binding protein n=1 Tax=Parasponia andersonii TaxID=3476 RepID=A0A2P5A5Z5_PARAD|nr:polyadenylate-binding protein 1-B-binding protein [Parasponia andersonii]